MPKPSNTQRHTPCHQCGECCRPVTTTPREIDVIHLHMAKYPGIRKTVLANQEDDPYRCCFLDRESNRCLIYRVRPLVCRGMGADGVPAKEHATGQVRLLNTEVW